MRDNTLQTPNHDENRNRMKHRNLTRKREGIHGFCHTCPYDGKRDNICIECNGASDNFGGMVHLDAYDERDLADKKLKIDPIFSFREATRKYSLVGMSEQAEQTLLDALRQFSSLSDAQVIVLRRLLSGETLAEIANLQGVTKQNTSGIWKRIIRKAPVFAAIAHDRMLRRIRDT